jgi:hypothetical protein
MCSLFMPKAKGQEEAVSKVNFAAASYFMECYIFD